MDFAKEIILENDVVLLRPLHVDDAIHLQHFVLNEQDLWKYSLVPIETVTDLQKYIATAVWAREQEKEYPFIVFDKIKKEYAGSTRFYDIQLPFKSLQIGYTWCGKKFQGTAVNKNCKLLLLSYAFETMGIERVEFRADNRNERSKQAMKSIGCTVEGVLRNHLPDTDGGRRDSIVLSILKDEWENRVKQSILHKINNAKK